MAAWAAIIILTAESDNLATGLAQQLQSVAWISQAAAVISTSIVPAAVTVINAIMPIIIKVRMYVCPARAPPPPTCSLFTYNLVYMIHSFSVRRWVATHHLLRACSWCEGWEEPNHHTSPGKKSLHFNIQRCFGRCCLCTLEYLVNLSTSRPACETTLTCECCE